MAGFLRDALFLFPYVLCLSSCREGCALGYSLGIRIALGIVVCGIFANAVSSGIIGWVVGKFVGMRLGAIGWRLARAAWDYSSNMTPPVRPIVSISCG